MELTCPFIQIFICSFSDHFLPSSRTSTGNHSIPSMKVKNFEEIAKYQVSNTILTCSCIYSIMRGYLVCNRRKIFLKDRWATLHKTIPKWRSTINCSNDNGKALKILSYTSEKFHAPSPENKKISSTHPIFFSMFFWQWLKCLFHSCKQKLKVVLI